jgi:uncharacterized protein YkwD
MRQTTGLLCAALALVLTVRPGSADDREKKEPPKPELTDDEKEVLTLVNKEREKAGLPPLKANPVLCKVARAHSANIVKQMKPDHVLDGKSFADRIKDAGYRARLAGENIGFGRGNWTAQGIVNWWMGSKPHRENILHKEFTEIGVGGAQTDKGEVYFTLVFAVPAR